MGGARKSYRRVTHAERLEVARLMAMGVDSPKAIGRAAGMTPSRAQAVRASVRKLEPDARVTAALLHYGMKPEHVAEARRCTEGEAIELAELGRALGWRPKEAAVEWMGLER